MDFCALKNCHVRFNARAAAAMAASPARTPGARPGSRIPAAAALVRAPLSMESPLLTTSYRSPYRAKQPNFFRSTSSFTAGAGAGLEPPAAAPEAEQVRSNTPPPHATAGTPPRAARDEPATPVTSQAWGNDAAAPYVSPFRSAAPASPAASPGLAANGGGGGGGGSGGGVGRYTSLAVSRRSTASSHWGAGPRTVCGSADAVAERLVRQAYAATREDERRKRRAEEQRKRSEELEQTIFGGGGGSDGGGGSVSGGSGSGGSSLRVSTRTARPQGTPLQRDPALLWGTARVPASVPIGGQSQEASVSMQRPIRSAGAVAGTRSPREAAAAEQRLTLQQRLQLKPSSTSSAALPLRLEPQPQLQPQPETQLQLPLQPQPQPEPEPEPEPEPSPRDAVGTPPGPPPPDSSSSSNVATASRPASPPVLSAFTIVHEQQDGSTTPPGSPPVAAKGYASATRDVVGVGVGVGVAAVAMEASEEDLELLESARKQQRAERRAALGALLKGLE
jgi:hypothetical protein